MPYYIKDPKRDHNFDNHPCAGFRILDPTVSTSPHHKISRSRAPEQVGFAQGLTPPWRHHLKTCMCLGLSNHGKGAKMCETTEPRSYLKRLCFSHPTCSQTMPLWLLQREGRRQQRPPPSPSLPPLPAVAVKTRHKSNSFGSEHTRHGGNWGTSHHRSKSNGSYQVQHSSFSGSGTHEPSIRRSFTP